MAGEPDDVDAMIEPVVPSRHRWLAGLLAASPGHRVVDLGCGTGGSLAQAAPTVAGGLLAGLDLSAAALARTAEAVEAAVAGMAEPPGLLCVQADLKASLPLADGAFDRVSATTCSRSCPTRTPWWPRRSGSCVPAAGWSWPTATSTP